MSERFNSEASTRKVHRTTLRDAMAVALIAIAIFSPTVFHDFVFDDDMEIVKNQHIRSLSNLGLIFTSAGWVGAGAPLPWYRPLTTLSYALNFSLSRLNPWSYHLANILLHGVVSALVFLLGQSLGLHRISCLLGAVVFAVHPIHVEVVANVAGRKDLLCALFMLLSVLSHAKSCRAANSRWLMWTPGFLALLAMLSKETGVVTIGIIFLWDWCTGVLKAWKPRQLLARYLPHIAAIGAYALLRTSVVGGLLWTHPSIGENPILGVTLTHRLLTATAVIGKGLGLLLLPWQQSPDYSLQAIPVVSSPLDPRFLGALAGISLLVWILFKTSLNRRISTFLVGWYTLTLLPASNVLLPVGTIFGERLLYIPSVAFCAGLATVLFKLQTGLWSRAVKVATVAALAFFLARTVTYSRSWRDNRSLFLAAVQVEPDSFKIQHGAGHAHEKKGDIDLAIEAYRRSLEILPRRPPTVLNLGLLLEQQGQQQEAELLYRDALVEHESNLELIYRLATILRDSQKLQEASVLWSRILDLDPSHAGALLDLGTFHFFNGETELAYHLWTQAAEADPQNPAVWYNLMLLHERRGEELQVRYTGERFLEVAGPDHLTQAREVRQRLTALDLSFAEPENSRQP